MSRSVEQLARPRGDGDSEAGARIAAVGEADGGDAAGDQRERERAPAQVLRRREHAGGDVTPRDDGLLQPREDDVDALGAEAAAQRVVAAVFTGGGGEDALEVAGELAVEHDALDAKARALVPGQAPGFGRRRGLQAAVDRALLLLAQRAFALLLALFFDEGIGRRRQRRALRLGHRCRGGQHRHRPCMAPQKNGARFLEGLWPSSSPEHHR